ncbi:MAG TPA: methylmalonyl-CoA mutase family protein [Blastocatellia bacterium]|nr:methylmalonyl-CoA mutase family protein [Blastocatellia bacterium]
MSTTKKPSNAFRDADERWEQETLKPTLSRMPERAETFTTTSLYPIERLYTPLDVEEIDPVADIGFPGEFPYTRGIHATGHRGKLWTMRQFAGFGSARDTNERFKYLLEHGQTGLSTAFDLPTLMGLDADSPLSEGEVGKCGVAVSSLADMEALFDGIPLEKVTTSMTINAPASMILAMYLVVAEKQGADWKRISGTLQNDILKEFIAQKEWIYPPRPSMQLVIDTFKFCTDEVPRWNFISVSGYHIREAGSTAIQELAFTLRDGIEYVQWAIDAGMDVDAFAGRISFFFNAHNDFFEEIAKYRAARRIWAHVMRDRFGAKDPRSWQLRFHTQTAGVTLTAQQPYNNVARVAIQALAGVLGGTQSLHTNSLDETLALPSEHAATIALRTQQIIAHETGVTNTVDPLAGSYFIEKLTSDMEAAAMDYIHKIDAMGGMVEAIDRGFPQKEIQDSAYEFQRAVERGEKVIVGVNAFNVDTSGVEVPMLVIDDSTGESQRRNLAQIRATRNADRVTTTLENLANGAAEGRNTMPLLVDCVREYVTLGEMCDTLREVYGEYQEPVF